MLGSVSRRRIRKPDGEVAEMTTEEMLKHAQGLPLHHPARMALLEAFRQIVELKQALAYANEALLAAKASTWGE